MAAPQKIPSPHLQLGGMVLGGLLTPNQLGHVGDSLELTTLRSIMSPISYPLHHSHTLSQAQAQAHTHTHTCTHTHTQSQSVSQVSQVSQSVKKKLSTPLEIIERAKRALSCHDI